MPFIEIFLFMLVISYMTGNNSSKKLEDLTKSQGSSRADDRKESLCPALNRQSLCGRAKPPLTLGPIATQHWEENSHTA